MGGLKGIESVQLQKAISGSSDNSLQTFSKNKIAGEMPSNSFVNLGGINGAQTVVQVNGGQEMIQSTLGNSFINLGGINGAQTMVQLSRSSLKSSSSSGTSVSQGS